jgi:acetyltransferase-like isoleucine patch superfamily enzyme
VKQLLYLIFTVLVSPVLLAYWALSVVCQRDSLWQSCTQLLSLFPGKVGSYLRLCFLHYTANDVQWDSFIGFGALFSHVDTDIAGGVYIGPQCNIGKCRIGQDTLLGSAVHILSGKNQHRYERTDIPMRDQGGVFEKISIGNNCWIGNGAVVMASVGDGSVVAAGAVVVNEVPAGVIVGGNPATVLKQIEEVAHASAAE